MKQITAVVCVPFFLLVSGCSTITQSEMQRVSITTSHEGKPLQEAECSLTNDKGTWTTKSPGQIDIRKSNENLNVVCKKEGLIDGLLVAISRAAGSMWGNIIFGGGIGALIDHSKGTGYDYPNALPVEMEKSITIDKSQERQVQQARNCEPNQPC